MTENAFCAVIIKGAVSESLKESADCFYSELKSYIEKLGFEVTVHDFSVANGPPGLGADMWVADKSCEEKLETAPHYIRTVNLTSDSEADDFKLTLHKMNIVDNTISHIRKLAEFQERIIKLADKICMS